MKMGDDFNNLSIEAMHEQRSEWVVKFSGASDLPLLNVAILIVDLRMIGV